MSIIVCFLDNIIIVHDSSHLVEQEILEEVVMEMTDPSENTDISDPLIVPVKRQQSAKPISTSNINAAFSELSSHQDISMDATSGGTQSERSASSTQRSRFPKPRPNLTRASRSTPAQQEQTTSHRMQQPETLHAVACQPESEKEKEGRRVCSTVAVSGGGREGGDVDERREANR